jgi:hypothetical protein
MTFHLKGLIAFLAFAAILFLATDKSYVILAIAAGIVLEVLMWRGVFGFGRAVRDDRSR